jgi:integrase
VQKLQSITIQQLLAQLLKKGGEDEQGLSPSTVAHVHSTLSACFSYGVKHGLLKNNPCQAVTPPRVPKKTPKVWDAEQTKRVLAVADDIHYGIYAQLVLYTGLRVNEALALRWSNVDLDKNIITVVDAIKGREKGKAAIIGAPKTDSGLRSIPFSPALNKILRAHRLKQVKKRLAYGALYTDRDLVIATNNGNYVRADNLRSRLLVKLVDLTKVPHIPLRNLRHTHATLLLAAGVHPKIVQERLGHSNVAITMDIYSSVLPNIQAAAVTEMDTLLSSTKLGKSTYSGKEASNSEDKACL